MSTDRQFKSQAVFNAWKIRNQAAIKVFNTRQRIKKGRKKYKPRNVNIHPVTLGGNGVRNNGKRIQMGNSLRTVRCPNCISKGMRQGLRQQASRSNIVFPYRQKGALSVMQELKIPMRRKAKA